MPRASRILWTGLARKRRRFTRGACRTSSSCECRYKLPDFDIGWLNARWVDLQQEFDDRLGLHNSLALKHALGAMDHKFEGTQHTALADAINTSAILTLMQDDAKFKETMKPVLEILQPKDDLASSIGDLCPELAKLQKDL